MIEHGIRRAFAEVIGAFVVVIIVKALVEKNILPGDYLLLINLFLGLGVALLSYVIPYWSTVYIIGWLFAMWLMFNAELIGFLEIIFFIISPSIILVRRIWKKNFS